VESSSRRELPLDETQDAKRIVDRRFRLRRGVGRSMGRAVRVTLLHPVTVEAQRRPTHLLARGARSSASLTRTAPRCAETQALS
jgi:hypothetical protein